MPASRRLMLVIGQLLAIGAIPWSVAGEPYSRQSHTTRRPEANSQLTPVLLSVFSTPRWFRGDDGKVHLVYELFLTNALRVPANLIRLDVLDGETGRSVSSLSGADLKAATSLIGTSDVPLTTLPSSEIGAIWLDLVFPSAAALPATLKHSLTVKIPPGSPIPETVTSTTPPVKVDLHAPVILGAPLSGDQWVAVGSCCEGPHRRALQPIDGKLYLSQRFAIDFNRLDSTDRFSRGNPAQVTSYPTYGQAVLAVADGTVVAAEDAYPDQVPGSATGVTLANADGNYVVVDVGTGHFAFYAHLKPKSVRVRRGDKVVRGQQIGEAGNTGSSDGPHLHFHVMNGPSALAAEGLPYVFEDFVLTGRIPPLEQAAPFYEAQKPVPIDRAKAGERHSELPLAGAVVKFPSPRNP